MFREPRLRGLNRINAVDLDSMTKIEIFLFASSASADKIDGQCAILIDRPFHKPLLIVLFIQCRLYRGILCLWEGLDLLTLS
ncbi:MAG TPA: hypothetical protein DD979_12050 [Gammaproteobacteria bacterium]|nr:hypothetical protein [Gammaproteobacteria bacterium]